MLRTSTTTFVAAVLFATAPMPGFAFERKPGFTAKVYWKIPFGTVTGRATQSLGFTMN